jgi:hypothetical protein
MRVRVLFLTEARTPKGGARIWGRRWRRDDGESGGTLPSNLTVAAACRCHRLAANARRHRSLARSGLLSSCFIPTGSCWSKPFQEWKEVLHFWVAASNDPRMGLLFPSPVGGLFFMFEPSLGMGHPMEQSLEIALYN